jgi:hypothetical protein
MNYRTEGAFGRSLMLEDATQTSIGSSGTKSTTLSQGPQRDWVAQQIALRPLPPVPMPVSYWKLDEVSGNASDSVGMNTLINNNGVTFTPAKINNGADFEENPSNPQSLSITDASQSGLSFSNNLSFAGWVKFESTDPVDGEAIFSKRFAVGNQRSYALEVFSSQLRFVTWTDGSTLGCFVAVTWTPAIDTFYHVAITKDSTTVKFFINGAQQGSTQTCSSGTIFNSTASFGLGINGVQDGDGRLDGIIDEAGAWNQALTASEISYLYNSGAGRQYPF